MAGSGISTCTDCKRGYENHEYLCTNGNCCIKAGRGRNLNPPDDVKKQLVELQNRINSITPEKLFAAISGTMMIYSIRFRDGYGAGWCERRLAQGVLDLIKNPDSVLSTDEFLFAIGAKDHDVVFDFFQLSLEQRNKVLVDLMLHTNHHPDLSEVENIKISFKEAKERGIIELLDFAIKKRMTD